MELSPTKHGTRAVGLRDFGPPGRSGVEVTNLIILVKHVLLLYVK